eukprot:8874250-Lingulodinium_polyedra.AAC.1
MRAPIGLWRRRTATSSRACGGSAAATCSPSRRRTRERSRRTSWPECTPASAGAPSRRRATWA